MRKGKSRRRRKPRRKKRTDRLARHLLLERVKQSSRAPSIGERQPAMRRKLSKQQREEWVTILRQAGYVEKEIKRILSEWNPGRLSIGREIVTPAPEA